MSKDDWTDLEREVMVEHRWWSLDELSQNVPDLHVALTNGTHVVVRARRIRGEYISETVVTEKEPRTRAPVAGVHTETWRHPQEAMPCIRCGKITVKLCTCSIEDANTALSEWSSVELEQVIKTLKAVLDSKEKRH